jgi:hypothetical protein
MKVESLCFQSSWCFLISYIPFVAFSLLISELHIQKMFLLFTYLMLLWMRSIWFWWPETDNFALCKKFWSLWNGKMVRSKLVLLDLCVACLLKKLREYINFGEESNFAINASRHTCIVENCIINFPCSSKHIHYIDFPCIDASMIKIANYNSLV